jgi:hypothetical protein
VRLPAHPYPFFYDALELAVIDAVDKRLETWATAILGDDLFTLEPPKAGRDGRGASFYLLELAPAPPPRSNRRAPLQVSLHYLVTTWAETPAAAHALLGKLVFAAMEEADFEVTLTSPPPEAWVGWGTPPQPSFVLQVPLRKARPEPTPPRVREPLVVQAAPLAAVAGVVLGPGDVPVTGALVTVPALGYRTRTDHQGKFRVAAVPAADQRIELRVQAKGAQRVITLESLPEEPLIVRFDAFESVDE